MSFKTLFTIIAYFDVESEQIDVVTAFLNSIIDELIYVEQSTRYITNKNIVYRLLRALYSLK